MRRAELPLLELALIAITRAMFGAGVALRFGGHLTRGERRRLGALLIFVGVISTIPLASDVFMRRSVKR